MIDTKAAQFLEIASAEELTGLLEEIAEEAERVDKSVIAEDIKLLKEAVLQTIQKIESAGDGEVDI